MRRAGRVARLGNLLEAGARGEPDPEARRAVDERRGHRLDGDLELLRSVGELEAEAARVRGRRKDRRRAVPEQAVPAEERPGFEAVGEDLSRVRAWRSRRTRAGSQSEGQDEWQSDEKDGPPHVAAPEHAKAPRRTREGRGTQPLTQKADGFAPDQKDFRFVPRGLLAERSEKTGSYSPTCKAVSGRPWPSQVANCRLQAARGAEGPFSTGLAVRRVLKTGLCVRAKPLYRLSDVPCIRHQEMPRRLGLIMLLIPLRFDPARARRLAVARLGRLGSGYPSCAGRVPLETDRLPGARGR